MVSGCGAFGERIKRATIQLSSLWFLPPRNARIYVPFFCASAIADEITPSAAPCLRKISVIASKSGPFKTALN